MPKGFFKTKDIHSKKAQNFDSNAKCGKCGLYKTCNSPQMPPTGTGKKKVLSLAQAPGEIEDKKNEQLIGRSGQFYREVLEEFGFDIDDGMKTNALLCRPPKNAKPTKTQIKCCHPNLRKFLFEYKPHVIISMGEEALQSLFLKKGITKFGEITRWRGKIIPDREFNCWICVTNHPSYIIRESSPEIVEKIFKEDIKCALKMQEIPLPERLHDKEEEKVEILKHPQEVINVLKDMLKRKKLLAALDYETTGLKPHRKGHKVYTCSISTDVDHAYAFPNFDDMKFIQKFREFLMADSIYKIAANIRFENIWSHSFYGTYVNNFFFDTMIGYHGIDNREKATNLEYQNIVSLGILPYDSAVKKYLKAEENYGNEFNRIEEADLLDVLIYNGMDSMTEFRNALLQMDLYKIDYSHLYSRVNGRELAPQYFI